MRAAARLLLMLGLLVHLPALGGSGEWTTAGPWGGPARIVAADPNDPDLYYLAVDGWGVCSAPPMAARAGMPSTRGCHHRG